MRRRIGKLSSWVLAAGVLFLTPTAARAHSALEFTFPANGAVLSTPPAQVKLRFRDPINVFSRSIRVVDEFGTPVEEQPGAGRLSEDRRTYTVPLLPNLADGRYIVEIHVLAMDGHPLQESLSFTVRRAEGQEPTQVNARQRFRLLRADPADGSLLARVPDPIALTFSERVKDIFGILLIDDRNDIVGGQEAFIGEDRRTVHVPMDGPLPPGSYKLVVYVVSVDDVPLSRTLYFAVERVTPFASERPLPFVGVLRLLTTADLVQGLVLWLLLVLFGSHLFTVFIATPAAGQARWRRVVMGLHALAVAGLSGQLWLDRAELARTATFLEVLGLPAGWARLLQIVAVIAAWRARGRPGLALLGLTLPLEA